MANAAFYFASHGEMKVVCYAATLPRKLIQSGDQANEKYQTLEKFARGANAVGDHGELVTEMAYQPSDVAVMLGWVHEHGKQAPHLSFRQHIIDQQRHHGGRVVVADSNLFLYSNNLNPTHYLRYSFDGVFPGQGEYCDSWLSDWRWQDIQRDMNIKLRDWRTSGDHILICLQRDGGWSMKGMSVVTWAKYVIDQLAMHTQRPFRLRAHPGDRHAQKHISEIISHFRRDRRIKISASRAGSSLPDDLKNCWALVNHNSSPSVGAVIEGVPVFVTDAEHSQCREVANTDLSRIEDPATPDRLQWICRISQFHWSHADLENGRCWTHMRQWIN